jgi:hypothetical protein
MDTPMRADIERANVQVLATHIARALFTNGEGEIADRLEMVRDRGGYLGGWSERAVIDQIVRVLSAPPAP